MNIDVAGNLDIQFYKKYPDLNKLNNKKLKNHWETIGWKTNRLCNSDMLNRYLPNDWNSSMYLKLNKKYIPNKWRTNSITLSLHYYHYGKKSGLLLQEKIQLNLNMNLGILIILMNLGI